MKKVKFAKRFDYTKGSGQTMTSYETDGGPDGDGVFEVNDEVAEAADKAGVLEAAAKTPPPPPPPPPGK